MSPRLLALAEQVKASPQAQAAIAQALVPDSDLLLSSEPQGSATPYTARRRYTIQESRSDRRKRLAALLRDNRDLLPDWTALASMARTRGFFPSTMRDRDIIQTLRAIGNDYGIARDEVASALELLKGDSDSYVNQPSKLAAENQGHPVGAAADSICVSKAGLPGGGPAFSFTLP